MKQRNLILLFCAVLLVAGCTEKKQNHMKSPDFEASQVLKDSMPEPVKLDSGLLSNAGTVVPYFPGGLKAMRAFIAKHVRYPEAARTLKKEGRVIISAQVDTKGNLSQYKVMMSDDPLLGMTGTISKCRIQRKEAYSDLCLQSKLHQRLFSPQRNQSRLS